MLGWLMPMPGRVCYTLVLCSGLEVSHFEVEITTGIKNQAWKIKHEAFLRDFLQKRYVDQTLDLNSEFQ